MGTLEVEFYVQTDPICFYVFCVWKFHNLWLPAQNHLWHKVLVAFQVSSSAQWCGAQVVWCAVWCGVVGCTVWCAVCTPMFPFSPPLLLTFVSCFGSLNSKLEVHILLPALLICHLPHFCHLALGTFLLLGTFLPLGTYLALGTWHLFGTWHIPSHWHWHSELR